jgi:hypothetical protein
MIVIQETICQHLDVGTFSRITAVSNPSNWHPMPLKDKDVTTHCSMNIAKLEGLTASPTLPHYIPLSAVSPIYVTFHSLSKRFALGIVEHW